MAMADLVMPRLPDQQHQHAFYQPPLHTQQPYQPPAHYHPQISPMSTNSNNVSPTSPKTYHTRQVRPLYMPAVLRPTEFPSKAPPKSPGLTDEDAADKALRSTGSFASLSGLSMLGRLSRKSTGDSGKFVDGDWNLDLFPKVTGLPSRDHWKPDSESTVCDEATCKRHFSYFVRRHHCRRCGNIFCDWHSSYEIPLDERADYNPRGAPSRACAHCFSEFKSWRSRTNSQASSDASSAGSARRGDANAANGTDTPTPASPITATPGSSPSAQRTEVAMSVPRDWNWSTF
ncbi:Vacuolar segregation protein pep7 [Pleurostoma richardsiae]|uniref:Vacuolar segregation protein pep7 n=1 Tax=Pleurostoma richardsiae TaxID=41990 RepID=A0AA38RXN0_9PEZI|nr:Vacuolar segregation protein pep7 [Pleurostoma richardsiae]